MAGRNINANFRPPGAMDYSIQAPGIMAEDAAAVRNVDYKTPPPAREGFTRSPVESDLLVCIICEDELGVEEEGAEEGKDQVWAGKCGHVSIHFRMRGFSIKMLTV